MTTIVERRQKLVFDNSWRVVKWDQAQEYVTGLQPSLTRGGVKAGDVVGVRVLPRQPRTLLFAEFKDFSHPNIPAAQRHKAALAGVSETLLHDIVRKVIDSLAGATFAHDPADARCLELEDWRSALGRSTTMLFILVCVELPPSQALAALAWTKKLQQRLRWLGPRSKVIVTSGVRPFSGLGITYSS